MFSPFGRVLYGWIISQSQLVSTEREKITPSRRHGSPGGQGAAGATCQQQKGRA